MANIGNNKFCIPCCLSNPAETKIWTLFQQKYGNIFSHLDKYSRLTNRECQDKK